MKISCSVIKYNLIFLIAVNLVSIRNIYSQTTSSLYMLPESFQAQMLNPAFIRNDKAIVIAVPGLGGGTLRNTGSFKISDLIRRQPSGEMAIDLEHFYNLGNTTSSISQLSTIPLIYVGIPMENGRLSFYLKEQLYSSIKFKTDAIEFVLNGNIPNKFRSYNTEEGNIAAFGYREMAVGYTHNWSEKVDIGIRGKLLFGVVLAELNDWKYGIETSDNGDMVKLSSVGSGRLALPYEMEIKNNQLRQINLVNTIGKYLSSYHNPGLAIDLGINYFFNEKNQFSFSVSDLGAVWFWHNSTTIDQNASYNFTGLELSNSLDYNKEDGFVDSYDVTLNTKDSIRNVFLLAADSANYLKQLAPKTVLHYQFNYSDNLSIGITNQTAFYSRNLLNTLSVSSKQIAGNFSFFENINLHGIDHISVGGGFMWEGKFAQVIFATDNLLAVYHPAGHRTFTLTAGISFLINKPDKPGVTKGTFSPYFPFYKKFKK